MCMPSEQTAGKRESMLSISKDKDHGREEADSTSATVASTRRILSCSCDLPAARRYKRILSYLTCLQQR